MKVIRDYKNLSLSRPVSAAAGFFDGFHLGHRKVTEIAVDAARSRGEGQVCAVTFEQPERGLITTTGEKLSLMSRAGVDLAVVFPPDGEWMEWTPEEFINGFLRSRVRAYSISVGPDFRFGKDRRGDLGTLRKSGGSLEVRVAEMAEIDGRKISSSLIKDLIKKGELKEAEKMLGRKFYFTGSRVRGRGLGGRIGYPTLNFDVEEGKLLPRGVFSCEMVTDLSGAPAGVYGACFIGEVSVGERPRRKVSVEVHLLDCDKNSEERFCGAVLLGKVRDPERFSSVGSLRARISSDIEKIRFDIQNSE